MTSVIVPPVDLAPGMPSRVVTISATDVTEGGTSLAGQMVRFALSDSLDVTSGGDVIAKSQAEVVLDGNGNGSIRLPVYNDAVKTWCGDPDWAIIVTTTWGSQKAIRVPAGTTPIALSALPPVRPLRGREKQWAVTGVSLAVTTGTEAGQASGSASLSGGILSLNLTVPPAGPHTHGLTGEGSPQGVVSAEAGTLYTETSVAVGDYFKRLQWIKKTPNYTASGWDLLHGVIERDIRPLASNAGVDATIRLVAKDGWTGIRISNLKPLQAGAVVEIFPSSGVLAPYAPTSTFQDVIANGLLGSTRTVQVNSAGRIAVMQASTGDVLNGYLWWPRTRDLPVSWIGDAA